MLSPSSTVSSLTLTAIDETAAINQSGPTPAVHNQLTVYDGETRTEIKMYTLANNDSENATAITKLECTADNFHQEILGKKFLFEKSKLKDSDIFNELDEAATNKALPRFKVYSNDFFNLHISQSDAYLLSPDMEEGRYSMAKIKLPISRSTPKATFINFIRNSFSPRSSEAHETDPLIHSNKNKGQAGEKGYTVVNGLYRDQDHAFFLITEEQFKKSPWLLKDLYERFSQLTLQEYQLI